MAHSVNWDSNFNSKPPGGDNPARGDDAIRELKSAVYERFTLEHLFDYSDVDNQGYHRPGSALAYYQSSAPTTLPDGSALGNDTKSKGRLWVDSDTGALYYYDGTDWKSVSMASGLPVGTILFFHGSWTDNSTLPGWYECTAANASSYSTADLEDRFIVVRGSTYSLNDTGGASTHVHTGPAHYHNLSNGYAKIGWDSGPGRIGYKNSGSAANTDYYIDATGITNNSGSGYIGTTTQLGGNTTTDGTGNTGSASSLPPYYALIAVERVS